MCGCIYRHPKYDLSEFINYLETTLKKITSESKEVYLCGDFNIDSLNIDEINNYQLYYNLLCSYGFLPLIVQPTRVVENQTPSLIDNIFCNNLSEEINSGNIYITLSEHFCQFASIKWTLKTSKCMLEIIQVSQVSISMMTCRSKNGSTTLTIRLNYLMISSGGLKAVRIDMLQ